MRMSTNTTRGQLNVSAAASRLRCSDCGRHTDRRQLCSTLTHYRVHESSSSTIPAIMLLCTWAAVTQTGRHASLTSTYVLRSTAESLAVMRRVTNNIFRWAVKINYVYHFKIFNFVKDKNAIRCKTQHSLNNNNVCSPHTTRGALAASKQQQTLPPIHRG